MKTTFRIILILLFVTSIALSHAFSFKRPLKNDNSVKYNRTKVFIKEINTKIRLVLPISSDSTLNDIVKTEINKQKDDFIKEVKEICKDYDVKSQSMPSDFSVVPVSIYKDSKVISYCFDVEYYRSGSVHPMDTYYSINYDMINKKVIKFEDYFDFKTSGNNNFLLKQINKHIKIQNASIDSPYNIDFNIEKNVVSFNFDDYEIASYAEGLIRSRVPLKALQSVINKQYR